MVARQLSSARASQARANNHSSPVGTALAVLDVDAGREIIGRDALPINSRTDNDVVARGREAWTRRKADIRESWADWVAIGKALHAGRKLAMERTNTSEPVGKRYIQAYSSWLEENGFADIDKSDRAKLLRLIEELDQVEGWRASLTETQRQRWNHPSAVESLEVRRSRRPLAGANRASWK